MNPVLRLATLALIVTGFAPVGRASEAAPGTWSTTSHFGFAVVDKSSTGFDKSSGSLVFLDMERTTWPQIAVGFRTIAQGASLGQRSFYRLGAGPLITGHIGQDWVVQLAAARFNETGVSKDDGTEYRSQGSSLQLGWERIFHFGPKVELAWGGFIVQHQGSITAEPAALGITSSHNAGLGHGVEAALRVDL